MGEGMYREKKENGKDGRNEVREEDKQKEGHLLSFFSLFAM